MFHMGFEYQASRLTDCSPHKSWNVVRSWSHVRSFGQVRSIVSDSASWPDSIADYLGDSLEGAEHPTEQTDASVFSNFPVPASNRICEPTGQARVH